MLSLWAGLSECNAVWMQACFDPSEMRLITVDTGGTMCCWGTETLHQHLRMTLLNPCTSSCALWSPRCATSRIEHAGTDFRELLSSEGIELNPTAIDIGSNGSLSGVDMERSVLTVLHASFVSDGCDILLAGSAGELICIDSVSGAVIWDVPAHLHRVQRVHICKSPSTLHIPHVILVDTTGMVRLAAMKWSIYIVLLSVIFSQ